MKLFFFLRTRVTSKIDEYAPANFSLAFVRLFIPFSLVRTNPRAQLFITPVNPEAQQRQRHSRYPDTDADPDQLPPPVDGKHDSD